MSDSIEIHQKPNKRIPVAPALLMDRSVGRGKRKGSDAVRNYT